MLGDTAVAVNSADERYRHLHGKNVLLPLMNREIPIITDDILANPEFGTGAVKVTPSHDPNDFEAGLRNNLPQIEVMNEVRADERERRPIQGTGPLRGAAEGAGRSGERRLPGRHQGLRCSARQMRAAARPSSSRGFRRSGSSRFSRWPTARSRWSRAATSSSFPRTTPRPTSSGCATSTTGASRGSCGGDIAFRRGTARMRRDHRRARGAGRSARNAAARLEQDSDVLDTWFSSGLLPCSALGWPDSTPELDAFYPTTLLITGFDILFFWVARMIMMNCHFMRGHQHGDVPFRKVYIHAPGARRRAPEDVEDQGQRDGPDRDHREVRHRCGALHAGCDGCAGHRHRVLREPHRKLSRLRQQDLERRALPVHERRPGAGGGSVVAGGVQRRLQSADGVRRVFAASKPRLWKTAGSSRASTGLRRRFTTRWRPIVFTRPHTWSITSSGASSATGIWS